MRRYLVALLLGASLASNAAQALYASEDARAVAEALQGIRRAIESKECR